VTTPGQAPPASYATRDQAAAYVSRVLARRPPTSPAAVYLIAAPSLMYSPAWERIVPVLRRVLPGCELLAYRDVFTPAEATEGIGPDERIKRIVRAAGGAVVIPSSSRPDDQGRRRYLLGYAPDHFGIWDRNTPQQPVETFPRNDDGWAAAWARYAAIETSWMDLRTGQKSG